MSAMGLDIRIPIGSLFVIPGALLAGYATRRSISALLGVDINPW